MSSPAPAPLGQLSLSTLMYLFCDRMMPQASPGVHGQRCWSTGGVVTTKTLAVRAGVVAVLGLRDTGVISLETYEEKKLLITIRGVRARTLTTPDGPSGIERAVIHQLQTARKPDKGSDVGDAFKRLTPVTPDPYAAVVQIAIDAAVEAGYLRRSSAQRGVLRKMRNQPKTSLEPDQGRIAAMKPVFEAFVLRWNDSYDQNKPLHDELQRTILHGISSREERGDSVVDIA